MGGGAGSPCNTMSPEPTSTSLSSGILTHPAVCSQQTKLGVVCPFLRGAGSSCNTMWPWPRPTPVSNGTLIHAPFGHNTWAKIACAIYIFGGSCTPDRILPGAKFILRPSHAFAYIGSVTARHSSSRCQRTFAALSRGRHLYSAGRPSRWASAHILVLSVA